MNGEQHELLTQNQDSVLWLTFNRPHKANALSLPLLAGLAMSLGEASTRNDVKAVVLTGVGERTFSAGADLFSGGSTSETDEAPTVAGGEDVAVG